MDAETTTAGTGVNEVLTHFGGGKTLSGGPTRACDNTLALLRSFIFTGQLEAGEKLPPERLLADQLGTSRITVGYALKALETLGFVEAKIGRNGGWWVVDAASLAAQWRRWKDSHTEEIRLMLEYGELMETEICVLAVQRRTPEELEKLRELLQEFEQAGTIRRHHFFHALLAQATHNPYLEQAAELVANQLFMPSDRVILVPGKLAEFYRGHELIVAAVEAGDPIAAREAMKVHYGVSRWVLAVED